MDGKLPLPDPVARNIDGKAHITLLGLTIPIPPLASGINAFIAHPPSSEELDMVDQLQMQDRLQLLDNETIIFHVSNQWLPKDVTYNCILMTNMRLVKIEHGKFAKQVHLSRIVHCSHQKASFLHWDQIKLKVLPLSSTAQKNVSGWISPDSDQIGIYSNKATAFFVQVLSAFVLKRATIRIRALRILFQNADGNDGSAPRDSLYNILLQQDMASQLLTDDTDALQLDVLGVEGEENPQSLAQQDQKSQEKQSVSLTLEEDQVDVYGFELFFKEHNVDDLVVWHDLLRFFCPLNWAQVLKNNPELDIKRLTRSDSISDDEETSQNEIIRRNDFPHPPPRPPGGPSEAPQSLRSTVISSVMQCACMGGSQKPSKPVRTDDTSQQDNSSYGNQAAWHFSQDPPSDHFSVHNNLPNDDASTSAPISTSSLILPDSISTTFSTSVASSSSSSSSSV